MRKRIRDLVASTAGKNAGASASAQEKVKPS